MKSKKKAKKKVFIKKGGQIMHNTNLKTKRSLCHRITEKYRDSWNPLEKIKFRGKCKDFMYEGEKICDIIWDRFDPEYGKEADPDPSWRPKRWCVYKPQRNNHSKSTENMYKKGELNRSTNIGAIINERERKKKYEEAEKGKFNSFKSPNNAWKYKNKVEKRKAATKYELADVNSIEVNINSNYNSSDEIEVNRNNNSSDKNNFSQFRSPENTLKYNKYRNVDVTLQPIYKPTMGGSYNKSKKK